MTKTRVMLNADVEAGILARAEAYVDKQLATMAKYGSAPSLSERQRVELILQCAKPAFEIEKWKARIKGRSPRDGAAEP